MLFEQLRLTSPQRQRRAI